MGLSFGKLLLLVVVVAVVWFGFRYLQNMQAGQVGRRRRRVRRTESDEVLDLERNPKTGAYEPRDRSDER